MADNEKARALLQSWMAEDAEIARQVNELVAEKDAEIARLRKLLVHISEFVPIDGRCDLCRDVLEVVKVPE